MPARTKVELLEENEALLGLQDEIAGVIFDTDMSAEEKLDEVARLIDDVEDAEAEDD